MKIDRDNIKGLAGTIVFHALLLLGLLLMALKTPLPLPQEAGVEVNLGNSDDGMGEIQPEELASGAPAVPPPTASAAKEEVVTEDSDDAPAIEPVKKEKPVPADKPEPKQNVKPTPKPEPQPVVNPNAMFKGMKGKTTGGGNEGITGKPGDQGKPNGSPGADNYDGTGGSGVGISFYLKDRGKVKIPSPPLTFKESGIVVVEVYVNPAGRVIRVISGVKGTTNFNRELILLAESAAKQAEFSRKDNDPEEKRGRITYNFNLGELKKEEVPIK